VLLVSSITPSGRAWVQESARVSVPHATFIDGAKVLEDSSITDLARVITIAGATIASPDLVAGLASVRSMATLVALWDRAQGSTAPTIAWFPGSVASGVTDLQALSTLITESGSPDLDEHVVARVSTAGYALERGLIELLVACPPDESAVRAAATEVAVAAACGIRVRGVAVCPMPRKSDNWPKAIRRAARGQVAQLEQAIHPIPVRRARRGEAPAFLEHGAEGCSPTVIRHADGLWTWSITVPGLSMGDVEVGTWSADAAYPTTHVVMRIDGRTVRSNVDATLRRCQALEAVVSGDSIAVTFEQQADQWPKESAASDG
jgi:hypothetical protein